MVGHNAAYLEIVGRRIDDEILTMFAEGKSKPEIVEALIGDPELRTHIGVLVGAVEHTHRKLAGLPRLPTPEEASAARKAAREAGMPKPTPEQIAEREAEKAREAQTHAEFIGVSVEEQEAKRLAWLRGGRAPTT